MAETRPLEILVIDDDVDLSKLLVFQLEGEHVDTASGGQEGIDMYVKRLHDAETDSTKKPYDLVLTDLSMPRVSGVDVIRKVKELSPNTLVYVVTAFERTEEYDRIAKELEQLKFNGTIPKPFTMANINRIIEQVRAQITPTQNPSGYNKPQNYQS